MNSFRSKVAGFVFSRGSRQTCTMDLIYLVKRWVMTVSLSRRQMCFSIYRFNNITAFGSPDKQSCDPADDYNTRGKLRGEMANLNLPEKAHSLNMDGSRGRKSVCH